MRREGASFVEFANRLSMSSWRLSLLLALLLAGTGGCAARNQKVEYDLDDVPRHSAGALSSSALVVEPLADVRDEELLSRRGTDFEPAIVYRDNDDWHFNGDDHYKSPVPAAVTEMLAEHLARSGIFKSVRVASPTEQPGELQLTGRLRRFESYMDCYSGTRAYMNQGGLLGLAIGAATEASYEADVTIDELRLLRTASGQVLWEGEVEGAVEGASRLIASTEWEVYDHANEALEVAVTKLVEELGRVRIDEPADKQLSAGAHGSVAMPEGLR
jgi:hypothetical protein